MTKGFKDFVRQIHLWLGLSTGIIVFIISITGCLYVFEEEIRDATESNRLYVPVQRKPFIGLSAILEVFQQEAGKKEKISIIRLRESVPNATVEIGTGKQIYYFNPYDAGLVDKGNADWLDTVEELHMTLLLGETGKFIQRWSVVIFFFMLLTGLVLWFPHQLRLLRQSLSIKWKGTFKRINYDLHNVLGFYASSILIVISLTGMFFAFKEVKTAASFLTGTKLADGKKLKTTKPAPLPLIPRYQQIYTAMQTQYPGAVSTSMSIRKTGELRLRMTYPYKWARRQNTFYYDASSGQLLRAKLYKDFNGADLIEASNYDIHTGRFFGLPGKIIACFASLISAGLPITGFIIWLKKRKKKKKPTRLPAHTPA